MSKTFSYRSDIDGLRALAVLLVVFFHSNFPLVTGGYIGVDVFFVISGFLITYTIVKEIEEGIFSFKKFYLRRIKRIIPVLVFILLVCTIPAYFMFAESFEAFARTLLHTILSTNNIHLWANNRQYFSESSELIPLLHTWSLSVEEQFYFIWPSMLLLLFKIKTQSIRYIIVALFLIVGLLTSIYLTKTDQNSAYFLLHGRVYELGIGAALAIGWKSTPTLSKLQNSLLSILGFLMILVPAFTLDKTSLFPGYNALLPCLGAAILIFTNKNNNDNAGIVNRIFMNKWIVYIGLISYSLYLWHWPVFVFFKFYNIELIGLTRILVLMLLGFISYFSWRYVEQPFRSKIKLNFKQSILYIMLPSIFSLGAIYAVVDANDGFPNRFPQLAEFNPKTNYPNKVRRNCFDKYIVGNCDECFLGIKKDTLDGVLIGDSFANHTAAFLDVLAKDANLYIHDTAAGGFALLADVDDKGNPNFDPQYGIDRLEYAKQFKTIYIASNWNLLTLSKTNRNLILKTIEELLKLNKEIVIFDCLPPITERKLHNLKLSKAYPKKYKESTLATWSPRQKDYLVYEIKKSFPQVLIIDLNKSVKNGKTFTTEIDGTIIFRTFDHLNTSGAKLMAIKYLEQNKNPLKK
jgi:peptidoglycan/LPS O-acetylase OafA/YrhL